MSKTSSGAEATQIKKHWDAFCKELPKKCEESGFTKSQITEMKDFAKGLEPGEESVQSVMDKYSEIAEANARASNVPEEEIEKSKDFVEFMQILQVTDGLPDSDDENAKGIIMDKFQVWLKQGKPRPELKKEATTVEKILRIYRRKWKGKQYLSYVVEGKDEQVGMKTDLTYGDNGDGQPDPSIIIKRDRYPTIEYTEKLARDLVAKAKRHSEDGTVQLRLHFQGQNKPVHNEANFFAKDFDEVIGKAFKGEII